MKRYFHILNKRAAAIQILIYSGMSKVSAESLQSVTQGEFMRRQRANRLAVYAKRWIYRILMRKKKQEHINVDLEEEESLNPYLFQIREIIEQILEKRNISYLTLNWFMQTLLDRSDRMAMYAGLELRVPFCDHRLVEYMWNVPWDMKAYNGREKGLLRHIMKEELPAEIVERKKSPYPKTWNPTYLAAVKKMLSETLEDSNAPIYELLNRSYIREILDTEGKAFTRPWFGQLMTGPQLMAYLCQVNMWLKTYRPKIEL